MSRERWLAVVGVGEDGIDGLTPAARRLVAQAAFVVGGKRHLALAGPLKAETMVWPSPIENALDAIEAHRGNSVCVLASGDPFFFGVGADADAPLLRRGNDLRPVAVRLCARRGAARLEPAGLRAAHSARPAARGDHSAPAPWRAHSRAVLGRRDSGQAGGAAHGARHGTIEAHNLRSDGRSVRADSHDRGAEASRSRTSPRSTPSRSKSSPTAARAFCPARPGCPTIGSSTTGRSPSARSAR